MNKIKKYVNFLIFILLGCIILVVVSKKFDLIDLNTQWLIEPYTFSLPGDKVDLDNYKKYYTSITDMIYNEKTGYNAMMVKLKKTTNDNLSIRDNISKVSNAYNDLVITERIPKILQFFKTSNLLFTIPLNNISEVKSYFNKPSTDQMSRFERNAEQVNKYSVDYVILLDTVVTYDLSNCLSNYKIIFDELIDLAKNKLPAIRPMMSNIKRLSEYATYLYSEKIKQLTDNIELMNKAQDFILNVDFNNYIKKFKPSSMNKIKDLLVSVDLKSKSRDLSLSIQSQLDSVTQKKLDDYKKRTKKIILDNKYSINEKMDISLDDDPIHNIITRCKETFK